MQHANRWKSYVRKPENTFANGRITILHKPPYVQNTYGTVMFGVGAAIGFPLGQTTIAAKVFEAKDAIQNGADEIDYMINLTEVKAGNWEYVKEEMQRIVTVCRNNGKLCKVILETCYLTKDDIRQICKIAVAVKPDFVKTSTGFGSAGATVEDVALMRRCVGTAVKVKASGGIRDARTFKNMVDSGALRIGTSAGVSIVKELQTEAFKHSGYIAIPEEY